MASQPQVGLVPPFTRETAVQKVRKAEDGWNSRDPQKVALAYTVDCRWRNRAEFVNGREEIIQFLTRKWNRELEMAGGGKRGERWRVAESVGKDEPGRSCRADADAILPQIGSGRSLAAWVETDLRMQRGMGR